MKRRHLLCLGILAVLACSAAAFGEGTDKIDLRLHHTQGQKFVQRSIIDQTITEKISGKTVEIKQFIKMDIAEEVTGVDEAGNADIRITYQSIYCRQQTPMGTFEYDSANPPNPVPAALQGFDALLGSQFSIRVSPKGKILAVTGLDQMLDSMIQKLNLPEGTDTSFLKKMCSEDSLRDSFAQTSAIYPESPVAVGDVWGQLLSVQTGFPLVMENTYKLKQRRNGRAIIACETRIKPNPNGEPLSMGGMKLTYSIGGKQTGTMEIDETTGLMMAADLKQDISGTMILSSSTDMAIPIDIKGSVHCEIVSAS